jgi:5-formyltetrahydrofolate cyclo-ligase
VRQLGELSDHRELIGLALGLELTLQVQSPVEVVLHRGLAHRADEQDVVQAGADALLDDQLERRGVDHRQELLGYRLGDGQEPRSETGDGQDSLANHDVLLRPRASLSARASGTSCLGSYERTVARWPGGPPEPWRSPAGCHLEGPAACRHAAARRALTDAERRSASLRIADRLLGLPELDGARTVLLYAALREEVDLASLIAPLHERGVRTLFPRVRGTSLDLVAAADLRTLQLGHRGVREPTGRSVDPEVVDVALVPGLAFDPRGGRLGAGGGHYDRLLRRFPARTVRVGVAFDCQLVPRIPRELYDEPVHLVVTERSVHRASVR